MSKARKKTAINDTDVDVTNITTGKRNKKTPEKYSPSVTELEDDEDHGDFDSTDTEDIDRMIKQEEAEEGIGREDEYVRDGFVTDDESLDELGPDDEDTGAVDTSNILPPGSRRVRRVSRPYSPPPTDFIDDNSLPHSSDEDDSDKDMEEEDYYSDLDGFIEQDDYIDEDTSYEPSSEGSGDDDDDLSE